MYLTLIILPLLGSIASGIFGRHPPNKTKRINRLKLQSVQSQNSKKFVHTVISPSPVNREGNQINSCKNYYYAGLFDAEGCFRVKIIKIKRYSTGWNVQLVFSILMHKRDTLLLEQINSFLGGSGRLYKANKGDGVLLDIGSLEGLKKVIDYLDRYPLITQKKADYELFKLVFGIVSRKEHLTMDGLRKIVGIRASLNKGLSDELKNSFPNVNIIPRPTVEKTEIPDFHWLAGFIDGEGSFNVSVLNSPGNKLGVLVSLTFKVTQHTRDEGLINSLVNLFGCGRLKLDKRYPVIEFVVTKFSDISEKIIPFLEKYPLHSAKSLDFADFRKVAVLMQEKAHLTPKGLEQIKKIKSSINSSRDAASLYGLRGKTEKIKKKNVLNTYYITFTRIYCFWDFR
jgi:hypothetical protein